MKTKTLTTILLLTTLLGFFCVEVSAETKAKIALLSGEEEIFSIEEGEIIEIQANFGGWELETDNDLFRIVERVGQKWKIVFNDNSHLEARSVVGEIKVVGDFGVETWNFGKVKRVEITETPFREKRDETFNRDLYKPVELTFSDSQKGMFYAADDSLTVKYKAFEFDLRLSQIKAALDWKNSQITLLNFLEGKMSAQLLMKNSRISVNHDLGDAVVNLEMVSSIAGKAEASPLATESFLLTSEEDFTIPIYKPYLRAKDWSNDSVRLDNRPIEGIEWMNVHKIIKESRDSYVVIYHDGKKSYLNADIVGGEVSLGRFKVPLKSLKSIVSTTKKDISDRLPENVSEIKIKDWTTLAEITDMYGIHSSEYYEDELHKFMSFETTWGWWLVSKSLLTVEDKGTKVITPFGAFVCTDPPSDREPVCFHTPYAQYSVKWSDIHNIKPASLAIQTEWENKYPLIATVSLKKGIKQVFPFEKSFFVRYPKSHWVGIWYNPKIGLSLYKRSNTIPIAKSSTEEKTDVELSLLKRILVKGGDFPDYQIHLENWKGKTLEGSLVPGEVKPRSEGGSVASWSEEEEGFWFQLLGGDAFAHIKMRDLSEITFGKRE